MCIRDRSGGPTSVINSSLAGVYKNAIERGFDKVYGMLHGIQGLLDEQYIDLSTQIHSELAVSYTHLDVYKRQMQNRLMSFGHFSLYAERPCIQRQMCIRDRYSQDGMIQSDPNKILSPEEIMTMNWLADNVVGAIPASWELTEQAQPVTEQSGVEKQKG